MRLFSKSVASITASLVTMMTDLEEHATLQQAKAARHHVLAAEADTEARKASAIHSNLANILN